MEPVETASVGSSISDLHTSLCDFIARLHDAIYMLPRQKPEEAIASDGYARDLVLAATRFEDLVRLLPTPVRRWDDETFTREVEELKRRDDKAASELSLLTGRAESLLSATRQRTQDVAVQLCNGAVSFPDIEVRDVSKPQEPAEIPPSCPVPQLLDLRGDMSRRFIEELEFVQFLANPDYVHWIARQGYFEEPAFVKFLEYLRYWRNPPYVYHVAFPQGLSMLEMLMDSSFRCQLHRPDARTVLMQQLMLQWGSSTEEEFSGSREILSTGVAPIPEKRHALPEVLQDLTALTNVTADKAWHEKMEKLQTSLYTIRHDAELIGHKYLVKTVPQEQVLQVFNKSRSHWSGGEPPCDLASICGAVSTQCVPTNLAIPTGLLKRLAKDGVNAPGSEKTEAYERKRQRGSQESHKRSRQ